MLKRLLAVGAAAIVGLGMSIVGPQAANAADVDQYTTPGHHLVNDRYWRTKCEMYSSTVVRCTTDIYGTKVSNVQGRYVTHNGWMFNNLTYLPSTRAQWAGNPLAAGGQYGGTQSWTQDGRQWRTECDNDATGRGGCRSYVMSTFVAQENGRYVRKTDWQFNNIVQFAEGNVRAVTSIPASAPPLANVPVEEEAQLPSRYAIDLSMEEIWDRIAFCESTNRWHINTGNGYYGGLQFDLPTWRSVNGQDFAEYPHQATREEQITVANRLHAKRGFQPWTCKP